VLLVWEVPRHLLFFPNAKSWFYLHRPFIMYCFFTWYMCLKSSQIKHFN
jgi:hypothetical protein